MAKYSFDLRCVLMQSVEEAKKNDFNMLLCYKETQFICYVVFCTIC